ncbi:MAG: [FeFe] hydrogenase H-cluster maturation GTPase HydF [Candidatus Riflebacteria bacterium]|nr:[FeFe] hydrogenase H-cluster maturation GTPase HydF [Candidatus Riflebacteria bacterium]
MSLNQTPRGDRVHISLFGRRNAGKSSLINALTGQEIALVSEVLGTTTDPVYKAMEILPIGPVVIIDTAGLDDVGELGQLRIQKTYEVLNKTDIAIVVIESTYVDYKFETDLLKRIEDKKIPVIVVLNKIDQQQWQQSVITKAIEKELGHQIIAVSATQKTGIDEIKRGLIKKLPEEDDKFAIIGDILNPGDFVVLVTPIDKSAPKGRLILPQQQVIRDILESDAIGIVTKEFELRETLESLGKKPKLVITDSQVFAKVSADTPVDVWLTSFSIIFARHKGDLTELIKGAKTLDKLCDGDKVLIAEGCTHHRQADDIGTVKIPRWIRQYTGKQLIFEHSAGFSYPANLDEYKLIVHCGACMLNKREMLYRIVAAKGKAIPIVNYGILIAYTQGILERVLQPFPEALLALEEE